MTPNVDIAVDQTNDSINHSHKESPSLSQSNDSMNKRRGNDKINSELLVETNLKLWGVAIPAITSQLVIIMVETISMIFVGQLNDTNAVAGVGLAVVYVNATTTSVLMGLNGAVSVLVSIAHGMGDSDDC